MTDYMIKRKNNMLQLLTQKQTPPELHPNNTTLLSTAPVTTEKKLNNKLQALRTTASKLPKEFDWRKQNGVELSPILNQGSCGSCWAMASTTCLADRWMIAKKKTGLVLDPLPTTVCTVGSHGCKGGLPENCQIYFASIGGSKGDGDCETWNHFCNKGEHLCNGNIPNCENLHCTGGFKVTEDGIHAGTIMKNDGNVDLNATIISIKTDIMLHGPVVAKFRVFGDFFLGSAGLVNAQGKSFTWDSTGGIYINGKYDQELASVFKNIAETTSDGADKEKIKVLSSGMMPEVKSSGEVTSAPASKTVKGAHAVEIVGWGLQNDIPYWIIKNSWGPEWNDKGYFNFAINVDGKTNALCGMDIPIQQNNGQLFGGTVSFIPDTEADHPEWIASTLKSTSTSNSKWWIWLLIFIVIVIVVVVVSLSLILWFRNKK
jgi:hypothetical protein